MIVKDNYLYVLRSTGELVVIDVSNPTMPVIVARLGLGR